jgi:hypothetical protein
MGLLVASPFAAAQEKPAQSATGGTFTLELLGRSDIASSKFTEYREVPKGLSIPVFNFFTTNSKIDFNVIGQNVARSDQRYTGWANVSWLGVAFDYNQIPHNMGNDGKVIFNETSAGVWSMSQTLQQALQTTVTLTPTANRTYPFYSSLLAPTFAAANPLDISSLRQRGNVDFDLGHKLPFKLNFTYLRELKTGSRGASGGDILAAVSPTFDVPEPLNEVVQDFGIRAEYPLKAGKMGNIHASFNRNVYNNQAETLTVANPFQATDQVYTAAAGSIPPLGGPASVRMINMPDNEANTGRFGVFLKFKKQTRLTGDVSLASWTQNAPFYPYTSNTAILTPTGQPASSTSSLQQPSLNGKINTTTLNFSFVSRPIEGLGIRMRYRTYDLSNKTSRYVITGDTSGSPDRSWGAADPPSAEAPYGHATAVGYDTTTKLFSASASYDFKALTFEGAFRTTDLTRTYREATSGRDTGGSLAAVYHAGDWVDVRAVWERTHRTAEGETVYGFQADEAERTLTRTGIEADLSAGHGLDFTFSYYRRNVDFPDRPDRVVVASGVPVAGVAPFPGTPSGLLLAKYDSFTAEVQYAPSEKVELGGYYTYEKDATTNQWSTTQGTAPNYSINNLLCLLDCRSHFSWAAHAAAYTVQARNSWNRHMQCSSPACCCCSPCQPLSAALVATLALSV